MVNGKIFVQIVTITERIKSDLKMRIDKIKFYEGTCKKCKRKDICKGSQMYTCARARIFEHKSFEEYTGIKREE